MLRISKQMRLVLVHATDSVILTTVAGIVVSLLYPFLSKVSRPIVEGLAALGYWGIIGFFVLVLIAFAVLCPSLFGAVVRGLFLIPRHFGLIAKTAMAFGVFLLVMRAMSVVTEPDGLLLDTVWVTVASSLVLGVGYCVVILRTGGKQATTKTPAGTIESLPLDKMAFGQWLMDDQPIHDDQANKLPEHRDVANRILNRLLLQPDASQGTLPSVAIMGAYGSGKTSICNLVRDRYWQRCLAGDSLPKLLFYQYEAWQYVTGEAAAKGLVEAATKAILEVADVPELWKLPDQYVTAVKEGGVTWARATASLFGSKGSPASVLSAVGEALERLGWRLVLFVDDLDRIEESAPQAQQAVTQALNQLQNVSNVQFVVAVGRTRTHSHEGSVVTYDLLKLTRFQEVVPRLEPKWIVSQVRNLRDQALGDTSICYPWAEVQNDDKDPLAWNYWYGLIEPSGLISQLVELLDTPRALKSALRETHAAWGSGLNGEINWYELLLACALRVAEPTLFEWIERDRDMFVHGPGPIERMDSDKQQQARAEELKENVISCLRRPRANRQKAVFSALERLFPAFASSVDSGLASYELSDWGQGIGYCPPMGRSYLERFLSGCLSEGELPDQPTLQLIRRIAQDGLDEPTFQSMYLDSPEKLTGSFNKFVQFAGLLSLEKALRVCDVILAWVATPGHALQWSKPRDYYPSIMGDVYHIIGRSDARLPRRSHFEDTQNEYETREQKIVSWLEAKIDQYAATAWAAPEALLRLVRPSSSGTWSIDPDTVEGLWQRLAERLRETFVEGDDPLLNAVGEDRFVISGFMRALRIHKDYADFRTRFTRKFVEQADTDTTHRLKVSVVISLVNGQYPFTDGECPAEAYTFSVDKEANDKALNMAIVTPALKSWAGLNLSDPVAQRAFEKLKGAYGLETSIPPGTDEPMNTGS